MNWGNKRESGLLSVRIEVISVSRASSMVGWGDVGGFKFMVVEEVVCLLGVESR